MENHIKIVIVVIIAALIGAWAWPQYRVWNAEMSGKAQMAEAEQNRQILIEEAKANLEAEKLNAEAEIERAKGMSKAMEIENGTLSERYIRYLWVRSNQNVRKTLVYVPTEGNLPVLESGRFLKPENPLP